MARRGGFSGGLSPFGSGTLGSLAQYDIGSDLADLSVYQTEVAWGNGLATDADYLAALRQAVGVATPGSQKAMTAQNKLDDAVYRIGRNVAENAGPDALVAFDQAALATMNPSNLRYRDVQDSLDAELAQRRSRDYGVLVDAYNAGTLPTQTLLDWVSHTLSTIDPESPDYANWTNVRGDLGDRITGEKDSQVYQDFQRGRMTSADFLSYITSRRDSYSPTSPKYADWAAKVEDATVQIKDAAQSKQDSDVFNRYQEGKVSDATYLRYLRTRLDGMTPDDPSRGEWQHRLNQGVFSLAEDKLRFDAERAGAKVAGKNPSAHAVSLAKAAQGKLMDFYTAYRGTLNPGSAEWRTVTRSIDSLARQEASFAKPTRRASGTGTAAGSGQPGSAIGKGPALTDRSGKIISPKYTLSNILGLFAINPTAKKKDVAAATKFLALNVSTLNNALNRGDDVWLFQDPRTPGAVVAALNPDGSPVLDAKGKPIMVRGSQYLPVASETFSNLKTVEAANFLSAGEVALAKGKVGDFASFTRRAGESLDSARLQDGQYRAQNWDDWYKATSTAVDRLTMAGDYGTAFDLSRSLAERLDLEGRNLALDDTRRTHLAEIVTKLEANSILPTFDEQGNVLYEGAVNLAAYQAHGSDLLNPGWHHVLKSNDRGQPAWGPVFDAKQDGSWDAKHVAVHTTLGDRLVTGEAVVGKAAVDPMLNVRTPDGYRLVPAPAAAVMLSFVDEHGQVQRAYSIDDGRTWIRPAPGQPAPTVEFDANLVQRTDAKGMVSYVDAATGDAVISQNANGGWDLTPGTKGTPGGAAYLGANAQGLTWFGQAAWEKVAAGGRQYAHSGQAGIDPGLFDMGAVGQHMTLAFTSSQGIVNLMPAGFRTQSQKAADLARLATSKPQYAAPTPLVGNVHNMGQYPPAAPGSRAGSGVTGLYGDPRRPVTYADITAQLPADTPARYDGYTLAPPPALVARTAPSSVLPGLSQPYVYSFVSTPPLLRPATTTAGLVAALPGGAPKVAAPPPVLLSRPIGVGGASKPGTAPPPPPAPAPKTLGTGAGAPTVAYKPGGY